MLQFHQMCPITAFMWVFLQKNIFILFLYLQPFYTDVSHFFPLVFLQQTFTNIKYPHHPRGRHDILPALLADMFRKMASDDIAGSDSLQQLLRLLQAPQRQNSPREGVLVLQQLVRPKS